MRVLKHVLPIDDQWHELDVKGGVAAVDTQGDPHSVSIWFIEHSEQQRPRLGEFRVFGTGHEIGSASAPFEFSQPTYVGTANDLLLGLVWHVFRKG